MSIRLERPPKLRKESCLFHEGDPLDPANDGHPIVTQRELFGWYSYDIGNSVYANLVLISFLPPFLTAMAKEVVDENGKVPLLFWNVLPSSYPNFIGGLSVLCQMVAFLTFAPLGDFGGFRKLSLVVTATGGAIVTIGLLGVYPSTLWLGSLIFVLSNVLFGLSIIFYNAFLPLIARRHPDLLAARDAGSTNAELTAMVAAKEVEVSARGFIYGYIAGPVNLVLAAVVYTIFGDENWNTTRVVMAYGGFWWLAWSFVTFYTVKPRPGPKLPEGVNYATFGWKRFGTSMSKLKLLPQAGRFLLSYFVYSDAFTTVEFGAGLFASEELEFDIIQLTVLFLITQICALVGTAFATWVQRTKKVPPKQIVLFNLCVMLFVPIVALPISTAGQFYALACVYGLQIGSVQAFSRALWSEMIPSGRESEFFSLYEVTDRGSSWLGPIILGLVVEVTGNFRIGFLAISFFFLVGIPLLYYVDIDEANREGRRFDPDAEKPVWARFKAGGRLAPGPSESSTSQSLLDKPVANPLDINMNAGEDALKDADMFLFGANDRETEFAYVSTSSLDEADTTPVASKANLGNPDLPDEDKMHAAYGDLYGSTRAPQSAKLTKGAKRGGRVVGNENSAAGGSGRKKKSRGSRRSTGSNGGGSRRRSSKSSGGKKIVVRRVKKNAKRRSTTDDGKPPEDI